MDGCACVEWRGVERKQQQNKMRAAPNSVDAFLLNQQFGYFPKKESPSFSAHRKERRCCCVKKNREREVVCEIASVRVW